MATQVCLMAEQCSKCGELFDLTYDLGRNEFGSDVDGSGVIAEVLRKISRRNGDITHFCWKCRKSTRL